MDKSELQQVIGLLAKQRAETDILIGRINAIHMLVLALLRHMPRDAAAAALPFAKGSLKQQDADLLATPLSDRTIAEHLRVLKEGIALLESAAASIQPPPPGEHQS